MRSTVICATFRTLRGRFSPDKGKMLQHIGRASARRGGRSTRQITSYLLVSKRSGWQVAA